MLVQTICGKYTYKYVYVCMYLNVHACVIDKCSYYRAPVYICTCLYDICTPAYMYMYKQCNNMLTISITVVN